MTTSPKAPPPGLVVGDYELLSRIGEGGMGVVHLARRPDGHRVALKVLRPHIVGDDEARERLAREVNSLSRIRSRWVAEIEDADPWGPVPFVATRYVPGLSLYDEVREEGPIEDGDDLGWFAARLAEGLDAVHSVGVLHRDVKPSNVLMEGRAPILIDFGLARVADDPRLTHTGWLLGTPGYLAPEILHGHDATAASDVHSWAATVAYAGSGQGPFGTGPSMAIMDRVRRGEYDLTGVSGPVLPILREALSPDPADRPSLPEVRALLEGDSGGLPAPSDPAFTMPMTAMAPPSPSEAPTHRQPTMAPPPAAPLTLFDDEPQTLAAEHRHEAPYEEAAYEEGEFRDDEFGEPAYLAPEPPSARQTRGARLRAGVIVLALWALAAAVFVAVPYVAVALALVLTWLLRAGSLAGSRLRDRRAVRGRRWFDAIALPLSYPWYFLLAVPGLALLGFWAAGLGVAAGLLAFAVAAPVVTILAVSGAVASAGLWWGPGGDRLRGPVRRLVAPLAANPWVWGAVVVLVAILAGGVAATAISSGVSWFPDDVGPFGSHSFFRQRLGI